MGQLRPDVLVLDIRMPEVSGIEVARRAGEISPRTRILAISAYDDDEYVLALMQAGAIGYMLKTASSSQLVDAAERVAKRESVLSPEIARKVARLWTRGKIGTREPAEGLTRRELRILALAVTGLRNTAIVETLGISVRTVQGHFRGIYSKLGVSSRVEAVLFGLSHDLATARKGEDQGSAGQLVSNSSRTAHHDPPARSKQ